MNNNRKVFVMMPFGDSFDKLYHDYLKPSIIDIGYSCIRADEHVGPTMIMDDIWQEINDGDVLIADLTGKNPNVYYELGLAHALSKPVILITQNIKKIPFDIKHIRVLEYTHSDIDSLTQSITEAVKEITNKSDIHHKNKYIVLNRISPESTDPLKLCFFLGEKLVLFGAGFPINRNPLVTKSLARKQCDIVNEYLSLIGIEFRFQRWMLELDLEVDVNQSFHFESYSKVMISALNQLDRQLEELGKRYLEACNLGIKWANLSNQMIWEARGFDENYELLTDILFKHGEYLKIDNKLLRRVMKRFNRFRKEKTDFSPIKAAKYFRTNRNILIESL